MGRRYLMRLGKTPFDAVGGFHTYDRNPIGRNNGNLIFGQAAHKLFSTEGVTVDANRYSINKKMADRVNDEYDAFILPLANAFRPGFEAELLRTTEFIENLTIPFLMLSGGAQLPLDGDPKALKKIEPTVKRFASAVLDKSSALSVRGELTAEYLTSLGFKDVVVVGCPSMTMNGRGHRVEKNEPLNQGAAIAYNLQTNNPFAGDLIQDAEDHYTATYMPQDAATLEMMLWASAPYVADDPRLPLERTHPQFQNDRAEFHIDAHTWISRMREMEFSFGPRIHGNIAAILAGTPAVVLAHDGRTLELSKYHDVPTVDLNHQDCPTTVAELYEQVDFTAFNEGHARRFDTLSEYIHQNGFEHIYDPGQEAAREAYERELQSMDFPGPQKTLWLESSEEERSMISVLQERHKKTRAQVKAASNAELNKKLSALEDRLEKAENRAAKAESALVQTNKTVKSVTSTVNRVERRQNKVLQLPLAVKHRLSKRRR